MKKNKKDNSFTLFSENLSQSNSEDNNLSILKNNKIINKKKEKRKVKKNFYVKISWKELIENYEILKIRSGVIHKRNIQFDIEVKNINNDKIKLIKMDNEKLKIIAPTLLCDYYESRLHLIYSTLIFYSNSNFIIF